jgi:hypothetical protein
MVLCVFSSTVYYALFKPKKYRVYSSWRSLEEALPFG